MVTAIVGADWGDEGKGKITDVEAAKSDVVVRFQGGYNAGHTIINNYGKFALHQLPSGVFYSHITNVIGNGVALNPEKFLAELKSLTDRGVPKPKIMISNRAQVLMPYHVLLDTYEEARLSSRSYGSTKSGIAPFYSDKFAKIGFQISELFGDEAYLREKIDHVATLKNVLFEHLYHQPKLDPNELYERLVKYREALAPYVGNTFEFLRQAVHDGKNILLEGKLGALKDPDFGIYPMVTSSNTTAAYGAVSTGIPPYEIKNIIAVVKAYSSAVGAGEFVSEISARKPTSCATRGATAGNSARPRAARAAWDGSTWLPRATASACRARRPLRLQFSTRSATWTRSRSASPMNWTENASIPSLQP